MSEFAGEPPVVQDRPEEGRMLLRDGTMVYVRPLSGGDAERLYAFLRRQSPRTLAWRFLGAVRVDRGLVNQLMATSQGLASGLSLVVTVGRPEAEEIIALGSYVIEAPSQPNRSASYGSGRREAEVAFLVDEGWQGRGIGTGLLERLAMVAWRQGVAQFRAEMRADNLLVRELLTHSGFIVQPQSLVGSAGEAVVRLHIVPTAESVAQFDLRDREATVASLRPLFVPSAVAVVGASRSRQKVGRRVLDNLLRWGFEGPVYAINPATSHVGPVPALADVRQLPAPVDLAVVAVPPAQVVEVVEALADVGVRVAVVLTAGFAEVGEAGRQLQDRLRDLARHRGIRLLGPNCLGVLNPSEGVRLNATFASVMPRPGALAVASQSGAVGLALLHYAEAEGLGVASFVSLGNKADISGNDLLRYWEDDPTVGVIALYLESFGNPRRFAHIARQVSLKKPILLIKAARTQAGARAAASHTAALASGEAAVQALCAQTGVIRVETVEELFEVANLLVRQPLPEGPRVAVVTNAGGPGILAADALAGGGLAVVSPSSALRQRLASALPPTAGLDNPFDLIASAGPAEFGQALATLFDAGEYDALLVIFVPLSSGEREAILETIHQQTVLARRRGNAMPVLVSVLEERPPAVLGPEEAQVPVFAFPESAARALAHAFRYRAWQRRPRGRYLTVPSAAEDEVRRRLFTAPRDQAGWVEAVETFAVLQAAGISVLTPAFAPTPAEAAHLARQGRGPWAVKGVAEGVLHKSDLGGVRLGLPDPAAVRAAAEAIGEALRAAGHVCRGFLVQPMASPGVECLIGMTVDPAFGPLIAFGLGGTAAEALEDVVFRVLPLSDRDAEEMVGGIRGHRLLEGYRNQPPVDRQALCDIILRVAWLADRFPEVAELDLNPVVARPVGQGVEVVDARLRLKSPKT